MKLNDKQSVSFKTNAQGYLVATGTKLARIGPMEYLGSELGKDPSKVYDVYVEADDLFNDATMQSFNNMPTSIHHPEEMEINSSNWDELAVGHITNVRKSDDGQFLIGDVIVNSKRAIGTINDSLIEVSLGYDADIEEVDGKLKKVNIRGNHLAIVDEGRCGSECKLNLNDGKPKKMADKRSILQKLFGAKRPTNAKVKFGDAKSKLAATKKKLNDSKADFDAKFKDVEAVVVDPNAPVDEKAAAIQELQDNAATLMEEATTALDEAQMATDQAAELAAQVEQEAPADTTVTDADVAAVAQEADAKIADLESQVQEKDAKIADLEAQLAALQEAKDQSATMTDAKTVFTKATFKDSMNSREIKATAVASTGAYTFADAMKLQNCALNSAYAAAKTVVGQKKSNIGSKLVANDAKPTEKKLPKALRGESK